MGCCRLYKDAIMKFLEPVKVRRPPNGYYDDKGRWKERDREEAEIVACIQPLRPEELSDLPEGRRTRAAIKVFTKEQLKNASADGKTQPDILIPQKGVFKGIEYQVDAVSDWSELGGYFKVLATKRGQ